MQVVAIVAFEPVRRSAPTDMNTMNSLDIAKPPGSTRVVVAMSGGVDSSVVAALLKRDGYDVVGVTLQLYDHATATHRKGACCAGQDIHDARNVAAHLGLPHYVLDYESRFRERVIAPFSDAYAAGETPVPCIACNQHVKFADLFDTARDIGADVLATGHYVVSRPAALGSLPAALGSLPAALGDRALFRARDVERDQSYFLFATTRDQLARLRFPLGDLTKAQVRALAHAFGLPVAEKADSQDICFVPSGRYTDIVARLRPDASRPGNIVDGDGKVVGRHPGIIHYTVGQRRGLGVAAGEPLYVVRLDAAAAEVVVGPRSHLSTRRVRLRNVNWIGDGELSDVVRDGPDVAVRVRSTRPPAAGRLVFEGPTLAVEFAVDEVGVSPGQACVLYESTDPQARVLGGGMIDATLSARTQAPAVIRSDQAAGACAR